jgi:hypothetical protein
MNGGAHRSHRFMTRGFDRDPHLFEPRNPPYYPALFEQCGFVPVARWYAYEQTRDEAERQLARFEAILKRRPPPGTIEELPAGDAPGAIARIHPLLDRCWHGHVGYHSLDLDEFAEVFRGGLSIMGPHDVSVYVRQGQDAGFALVLPDYAAQVRALNGSAAGWGQWLGRERATRILLHTAALVPDARQASAAMAQVAWALRRAVEDGFQDVLYALVIDGFLSRISEQKREYTLYGRSVAA